MTPVISIVLIVAIEKMNRGKLNDRYWPKGDTMNCPDCNVYMDLKSYNGFDVSWCYKCTGVWIEQKILLEMLGQTLLLSELDDAIGNASKPTKRKCPKCKEDSLKELNFKNCILDFCPNCEGIYFDSGELRKTFPFINNSLQGINEDDKLWNQTVESERMIQNNPFLNSLLAFLARIGG